MNLMREITRECDQRTKTIKQMTQNGQRLSTQDKKSARTLIGNAIKWDCDRAAFALSLALDENMAVV